MVAGASTTPAVTDAVRASGVPCHADEERPIVAVVGWPPVLRGRHHLFDVLLQRIDVKGLNRLSVVEILVHRIGQGRILAENLQVQLIRPPVLIGSHFVPPVKKVLSMAQPSKIVASLRNLGIIKGVLSFPGKGNLARKMAQVRASTLRSSPNDSVRRQAIHQGPCWTLVRIFSELHIADISALFFYT